MSSVPEQAIRRQFLRLFEHSEMYTLYKFLNTPKGRQIVRFSPNEGDNQRTFYFNTTQLRNACQPFKRSRGSLIRVLEKSGMNVRLLEQKKGKTKYWAFSHQTLTIKSTKEQIMEAWGKGLAYSFVHSGSLLTRIYLSLQQNNYYVQWNDQGNSITVNQGWSGYKFGSWQVIRKYGFSTAQHPDITNRLLRRESPIYAWIVVWMTRLEKYKKWRASARDYLEKIKEIQGKGKKKKKPEPESIKTMLFMQEEQSKLLNLFSEKQGEKENSDALNKQINRAKGIVDCMKIAMNIKVDEVKAIIKNINRRNQHLELTTLYNLFDSIVSEQGIQRQEPKPKPNAFEEKIEKNQNLIQRLHDEMMEMNKRIALLQSENTVLQKKGNE